MFLKCLLSFDIPEGEKESACSLMATWVQWRLPEPPPCLWCAGCMADHFIISEVVDPEHTPDLQGPVV